MARLDPLLPNAAIVARREYRDRVRSRLYLASTLILMTLALGVALTPIAVRYLDKRTVTQLAIVSAGCSPGRARGGRRRRPAQQPTAGRGPGDMAEAVQVRGRG